MFVTIISMLDNTYEQKLPKLLINITAVKTGAWLYPSRPGPSRLSWSSKPNPEDRIIENQIVIELLSFPYTNECQSVQEVYKGN